MAIASMISLQFVLPRQNYHLLSGLKSLFRIVHIPEVT